MASTPSPFRIQSAEVTLVQEVDSASCEAEPLTLKIKTEDAGAGPYIILETERFCFESKEEWLKVWDTIIEPMLKNQEP
jgi:hypothetical protein